MNQGIFHKRIPTVFALFILIVGLVTTAILVQKGVFTTSRATPNEEPQNIKITNLTNNSFTVTFTTLDPTIAAVNMVSTDPQKVVYDFRNPGGGTPFKSHFITVSDLKPETTYEFNIISNGTIYQENGKNFTVTTARGNAPSNSNGYVLSGTILLPDGSPASDVLITATIPNSALVSTVTDNNGAYEIPTNLIRNPSHDQILTLVPGTTISISAIKGNDVSTFSYQYQTGIKIPTIILSQNYSFITSEKEMEISTSSSLLTLPSDIKKPSEIKISTPKNNQSLTDIRPLFKGTAFPNTLVSISIQPNPISVQVRTDPNGNWAYRPAVTLTPGKHSITIQAPDNNGVTRTETNSFTIFASGSQIAESATPSATFTPTPTTPVTPTATPTPTIISNPTPTPIVSPTPTIAVVTPTAIIIPTNTPTPTTIVRTPTGINNPPALPPTGDSSTTVLLTMISIIFIVSGSALLFIL